MLKKLMGLTALAALAAGACTQTQEIKRAGKTEFLISCGAATGFGVCYDRANEVCPAGYETVSEKAGFNRKELRVACAR